MAHFYGTLRGNRGEVTRTGSSELVAHAASWQGAVRTHLFHDPKTGRDMARVTLVPWRGTGCDRLLYEGPVNPDAEG